MYKGKKVIVVLPAYNAEKTLKKTYDDINKSLVDEIILVDDCSKDKTVELSRKLGITTIVHKKNLGYGGNQKTCYKTALEKRADIVVMIHPDYQYDPKILEEMIFPIASRRCHAVFASRFLYPSDTLSGGMPVYKYIGNRILTFIENLVLRVNLSEFHTGYRAWSKELLKDINFNANSNDFVFDTQMIIQVVNKKYRIREIPVETRYFGEASSISLKRSIIYGFSIFRELGKYLLTIWKIKKFKEYRNLN
ncbi:MAG: glycosyltransferase family 2 protein [archaeon]